MSNNTQRRAAKIERLAADILKLLKNEFLPDVLRDGMINGLGSTNGEFESDAEELESLVYIKHWLLHWNGEADKKDYIAVLMQIAHFPDTAFKRSFAEFCFKQFVAEAAEKALEIKREHGFSGKAISCKQAADLCLENGIFIDVEADHSDGHKESWFGKINEETQSFKYKVWINPTLSFKKVQRYLLYAFAVISLSDYTDLHFRKDEQITAVEEMKDTDAPLFRAVMLADCLTAMLMSTETEAELIAFQSEPRLNILS